MDLPDEDYRQLRAIARGLLCRERPGHTLQATALAHEAWLRLIGTAPQGQSPPEELVRRAVAVMRRLLVDHARRRGRAKRGGGALALELDSAELAAGADPVEFLALEAALQRLSLLDARAAEVVSLRFHAGLDVAETAAVLGLSARTVKREWAAARAFLFRELRGQEA